MGVARIHDVIEFNNMNKFYNYRDRHKCKPSWYTGREKGFLLQDVQAVVEPVEMNGQLNLFNIELDVELVD